jgi:hypothetical protein
MRSRQLGLLALAVCAALVIALFLRDAVEQLLIRPAAYLFWWLGVFYRFLPQPVLWFLLILVMLYLTLGSLAEKLHWPGRKNALRAHRQGPVEEFAAQIERRQGGIFFKWQIARTLSEVALDLQELRQHTRRRQLEFDDETVPVEVRRFLEAGLMTSFSDYPLPPGPPLPQRFRALPPTPFDLDLEPVIAYLESQLENDDDFKRP